MGTIEHINSTPVESEQLTSFTLLGEEFIVPVACIRCAVLDPKSAGETLGMSVPLRDGALEYFPEHKIPELKSNLLQRADDAVSGACRFILKQQCWRVEKIEE